MSVAALVSRAVARVGELTDHLKDPLGWTPAIIVHMPMYRCRYA